MREKLGFNHLEARKIFDLDCVELRYKYRKYGHKEYHACFSPYVVVSLVKESRLRCAGRIVRMKRYKSANWRTDTDINLLMPTGYVTHQQV